MKRIGIGLSDFKELIEEDFYYFDKTKFIDEIVKDGAKVKLFARPRRFGKTLNMSMLKYFFDIKKADENKKLFKNLYIEKTDSFKEQGQYPVVFLSLKDLKAITWEEMERKIIITLSDFFSEYEYLLNELTGVSFENLKNIIYKKSTIDDLTTTLKFLTKILYEKYNKKSDLNNLSTYTILSDVYTDSYGLTEEEVEKSLKDYGIEAEISKVKDWYDGYKFGDSEVYNPWSIINFLRFKELRAYWVDTSENDLINDVLKQITKDTIRALERLFDGEGLRQNISGTSDLSKLLDENELWELLLFSGYLTIEEKIDQKNYILRLPNKEVKELFKDSFLEKYFGRGNKLSDLMEALTENRIEDYEESLQEILLTSVSYNDTKKGNEAFYHGLIMGMGLYLEGEYITKSNIESGLGRYDFLIEPKNKSKRAFIMEFKCGG